MSLSFPSIWVPGSSSILASCLIGKEAISSVLLDQWVKPVSKAVINGCPGVLYGRKFKFFPASFCNKLSYLKLSYSSTGAIKNYEKNVRLVFKSLLFSNFACFHYVPVLRPNLIYQVSSSQALSNVTYCQN